MTAAGVDELVEHLLFHVAVAGSAGIGAREIQDITRKFYDANNSNASQTTKSEWSAASDQFGLLFSTQPPAAPTVVDDALINAAWQWVSRHPDVAIKEQSDESHDHDDNSPSGLYGGSALAGKRLYTSESRTWYAIAGHGVDHAKLPPLEFVCLSAIARYGSAGVLQPEVTRITGQDKRSLPKRTAALAAKGYITKETVVAAGARTSLLRLARKSMNGVNPAQIDVASVTTPQHRPMTEYEAWYDKTISLLHNQAGNLIAYSDLRMELGISGSVWTTRALNRCIRRLVETGCFQRVSAVEAKHDDDKPREVRCVKLLREATSNDRAAWLSTRATDDTQTLQDDPADDSDREEIEELDSCGNVSLWSPMLPITNLVFRFVDETGPEGISSMDLHTKMSVLWRRPMDELMNRLTDDWQHSQPSHLRHLSIIKDTAQKNTTTHFVYRTYHNFELAVQQGMTAWEAVQAARPDSIKSSDAGVEYDEWGFARPQTGIKSSTSTAARPSQKRKQGQALKREDLLTLESPRARRTFQQNQVLAAIRQQKEEDEFRKFANKVARQILKRDYGEHSTLDAEKLAILENRIVEKQDPRIYINPPGAADLKALTLHLRGRWPKYCIAVIKVSDPSMLAGFDDDNMARKSSAPISVDQDTQVSLPEVPSTDRPLLDTREDDPVQEVNPNVEIAKSATEDALTAGSLQMPQPPQKKRGRPTKAMVQERDRLLREAKAVEARRRNIVTPLTPTIDPPSMTSQSEQDVESAEHQEPEVALTRKSEPSEDALRPFLQSVGHFITESSTREPSGTVSDHTEILPASLPQGDRVGSEPDTTANNHHDGVGVTMNPEQDKNTPSAPFRPHDLSSSPDDGMDIIEGENGKTPESGIQESSQASSRLQPNKRLGTAMATGIVYLRRTQMILDIIKQCGGVFPGNNEIWYPLATSWEKVHSQRPDRVTVENTIRNLLGTRKLKRTSFQVKRKSGAMETRYIIMLPDVELDDPKVADLREKIIAHAPARYVPEELDIAPDLRTKLANFPTAMGRLTSEGKWRSKEGEILDVAPPHYSRDHFSSTNDVVVRRRFDFPTKLRFIGAAAPSISPQEGISSALPQGRMIRRIPQSKPLLGQMHRRPLRSKTLGKQAIREAPQSTSPYYQTSSADLELQRLQADLGVGESAFSLSNYIHDASDIQSTMGFLVKGPSRWPKRPMLPIEEHIPQTRHMSPSEEHTRQTRHRLQREEPQEPFLSPSPAWEARPSVDAKPEVQSLKGKPAPHSSQGPFSALPTYDTTTPALRALHETKRKRPGRKPKPRMPVEVSALMLVPKQIVHHSSGTFGTCGDLATLGRKRKHWSNTEHERSHESAAGKINSNSDETDERLKRPRRIADESKKRVSEAADGEQIQAKKRQRREKLDSDDTERLLASFALVRLLTAGVGQRICNWDIVAHCFDFRYDGDFLRQQWIMLRRDENNYVNNIQNATSELFLRAYDSGEIRAVDFDNLGDADWVGMVDWVLEKVVPNIKDVPPPKDEFPSSLEDLYAQYDIEPGHVIHEPNPDEFFNTNMLVHRSTIAHRQAHGVTMRASTSPSVDHTLLVKSWCRAVAMASEKGYDAAAAANLLTKHFSTAAIAAANKDLLAIGFFTTAKKDRQMPGRNYHLAYSAVRHFRRWPEKEFLPRVAAARQHILHHFASHPRLTLTMHTDDTQIVVLTSLVAQGHISAVVNLPARNDDPDATGPHLSPWGFVVGDYATKQQDSSKWRFPLSFERMPALTAEHGLVAIEIPRQPRQKFPGEAVWRIPFWMDIQGNLLAEAWDLALSSVLHLVVFRLGVTAAAMEASHRGMLAEWEIRLVLDWMLLAGIVERCGLGALDGNGNWSGGWRATSWWYCTYLPEIATWRR